VQLLEEETVKSLAPPTNPTTTATRGLRDDPPGCTPGISTSDLVSVVSSSPYLDTTSVGASKKGGRWIDARRFLQDIEPRGENESESELLTVVSCTHFPSLAWSRALHFQSSPIAIKLSLIVMLCIC